MTLSVLAKMNTQIKTYTSSVIPFLLVAPVPFFIRPTLSISTIEDITTYTVRLFHCSQLFLWIFKIYQQILFDLYPIPVVLSILSTIANICRSTPAFHRLLNFFSTWCSGSILPPEEYHLTRNSYLIICIIPSNSTV